MSISTDGGSDADASTKNCPDCGSALTHELITEHGAEKDTTEYVGWWCPDCAKGMVHCGECKELHHPDHECGTKLSARRRAVKAEFGGLAGIPDVGTVPIEECETNDQGSLVFRKGTCPEDDCDGDHLVVLSQNEDYWKHQRPMPEYTPVAQHCSNFDHSDDDACSFHKP